MPEVQKKVPEKKVPEKKIPEKKVLVPKKEAVPPTKGIFGKIFVFVFMLHAIFLLVVFLHFEFTSLFLQCLKK